MSKGAILMNRSVSYLLCQIGFLAILGYSLPCTQAIADSSSPLTLIYSGQEQGVAWATRLWCRTGWRISPPPYR